MYSHANAVTANAAMPVDEWDRFLLHISKCKCPVGCGVGNRFKSWAHGCCPPQAPPGFWGAGFVLAQTYMCSKRGGGLERSDWQGEH